LTPSATESPLFAGCRNCEEKLELILSLPHTIHLPPDSFSFYIHLPFQGNTL
jgi:hypothetical protein